MTTSEKPTHNGTTEAAPVPFNKVISHLKSFPVISDSISTLQAHPIGQRSISIYSTACDTILKPITPYLVKANEIASPYVSKADDIADQGLGKVEAKFPILKEPTENVKSRVMQIPSPKKIAGDLYGTGLDFANQKKEYVLSLYNVERAKDGSQGFILPAAKAGLTTTFVVAQDGFQWIVDHLAYRKESVTDEKANGVRQ